MAKSPNFILRQKKGRGFTYSYEKSRRKLQNQQLIKWIKQLVIPPAWTDVHIDPEKNAKVHAWGRDDKGRKQYIYNPKWRARQEKKKFNHIVRFAEKLPVMRKKTSKHLEIKGISRKKVLACMTRLIDNAYFRPGNRYYTKENESYGLTTLRSKHLEIDGERLEFQYQGKSGKGQKRIVEDKRLAKVVKKVDSLPGYRIFKYIDEDGNIQKVDANELNEYIKSIMGEEFSAKDFRTWAGTYLASQLLSELDIDDRPATQQKNLVKVIDQVAESLGNTRSIARASYIDPRVIDNYSKGVTINNYIREVKKELKSKSFMSPEELALIKLLKHK